MKKNDIRHFLIRNGAGHHGPERPHLLLQSSAPCEAHSGPYGSVVCCAGPAAAEAQGVGGLMSLPETGDVTCEHTAQNRSVRDTKRL